MSNLKQYLINQNTPVSLALAITIGGLAFYFGETSIMAKNSHDRVTRMEEKIEREISLIRKELHDMSKSTSEMSGKVDIIIRKIDRRR